jgi:hypothetical protein
VTVAALRAACLTPPKNTALAKENLPASLGNDREVAVCHLGAQPFLIQGACQASIDVPRVAPPRSELNKHEKRGTIIWCAWISFGVHSKYPLYAAPCRCHTSRVPSYTLHGLVCPKSCRIGKRSDKSDRSRYIHVEDQLLPLMLPATKTRIIGEGGDEFYGNSRQAIVRGPLTFHAVLSGARFSGTFRDFGAANCLSWRSTPGHGD